MVGRSFGLKVEMQAEGLDIEVHDVESGTTQSNQNEQDGGKLGDSGCEDVCEGSASEVGLWKGGGAGVVGASFGERVGWVVAGVGAEVGFVFGVKADEG